VRGRSEPEITLKLVENRRGARADVEVTAEHEWKAVRPGRRRTGRASHVLFGPPATGARVQVREAEPRRFLPLGLDLKEAHPPPLPKATHRKTIQEQPPLALRHDLPWAADERQVGAALPRGDEIRVPPAKPARQRRKLIPRGEGAKEARLAPFGDRRSPRGRHFLKQAG